MKWKLLAADFHLFLKNKGIFLVFVTGCILSSILFTYTFGNSVTYMASRDEKQNVNFRTYECTLKRKEEHLENAPLYLTADLMETVAEMFSAFPVEDILFSSGLMMTSRKNSISAYANWKDGQEAFTEEQVKNAEQVIFISDTATANETSLLRRSENAASYRYRYDDKESYKTNTYSIRGIFTHWNIIGYIPYTTFIKEKYELTQLNIITSRRLNDKENEMILEVFECLPFGIEYNSMYPFLFKDEEMSNSITMILLLAFIYMLAVITYLYMIKFIVENNRYYYNIHALFGASRLHLAIRFFVELMLVVSVTNIAGISIHAALYDLLFEKINLITNICYYFNDYITIFGILTCTACVVTLPYSIKFTRCNIAELYRNEE